MKKKIELDAMCMSPEKIEGEKTVIASKDFEGTPMERWNAFLGALKKMVEDSPDLEVSPDGVVRSTVPSEEEQRQATYEASKEMLSEKHNAVVTAKSAAEIADVRNCVISYKVWIDEMFDVDDKRNLELHKKIDGLRDLCNSRENNIPKEIIDEKLFSSNKSYLAFSKIENELIRNKYLDLKEGWQGKGVEFQALIQKLFTNKFFSQNKVYNYDYKPLKPLFKERYKIKDDTLFESARIKKIDHSKYLTEINFEPM